MLTEKKPGWSVLECVYLENTKKRGKLRSSEIPEAKARATQLSAARFVSKARSAPRPEGEKKAFVKPRFCVIRDARSAPNHLPNFNLTAYPQKMKHQGNPSVTFSFLCFLFFLSWRTGEGWGALQLIGQTTMAHRRNQGRRKKKEIVNPECECRWLRAKR